MKRVSKHKETIGQSIKHYKGLWVFGLILGLLVIIYLLGVAFYQSRFLPNTYAGQISLSNLGPDKAQKKLVNHLGDLDIYFKEGQEDLGFIPLGALELDLDQTKGNLEGFLAQQNPWEWPIQQIQQAKYLPIGTDIFPDKHLLNDLVTSLGIHNEERQPAKDAKLLEDEAGNLQVEEEVYGRQVTGDSLGQTLADNLSQGKTAIDLGQAYVQPQVFAQGSSIEKLKSEYQEMKETQITLVFNNQEVRIPSELIEQWLSLDDQGQAQVNREEIEDYLYQVNVEYAGLFSSHDFLSTYQGWVTVDPGTFGWYIDRFQEAEVIADNILAGGSYKREPIIGGQGYQADNEFGSSYVEVDLTNQMMLVYVEGKLVLETPIVSGNIGTSTVPGAYQVWQMLENTDLRGYNPRTQRDYVQPVSYWIAFDDNAQGIHDASWQSSFGGTVYQNAGSLGCINTPPSIMGQVFETVYVGMPVVIF